MCDRFTSIPFSRPLRLSTPRRCRHAELSNTRSHQIFSVGQWERRSVKSPPSFNHHWVEAMLRITIVAYLAFTTVLGPGLCCCHVRQLLSLHGGDSCCVPPLTTARIECVHGHNLGHRHDNHEHVQAGHSHAHSPVPESGRNARHPVFPSGDQKDCPCGRHHAINFLVPAEIAVAHLTQHLNPLQDHVAAHVHFVAGQSPSEASFATRFRPFAPFGKGILRAFPRLRC